jgi:diguanylate cyclase (GGDEF)-like protein
MKSSIYPIVIEKEVLRHAYLIMDDKYRILLDPGAEFHLDILIEQINTYTQVELLDFLVLQSSDLLNITSINHLLEKGFKGKIIVNQIGTPYLNHMIKADILTLEDIEFEIEMNNKDKIQFIKTPFLPFPDCFCTYHTGLRTLFSGHLFSQSNIENKQTQYLINSINQFHESILPSVEFVRQNIKKLRKYNIEKIYPRLGYTIEKDIDQIIDSIIKYDFYNTNQVVAKINDKNVSYNYESICNHMLKVLEKYYHREEILDIFDNSDIRIDMIPHLEIDYTSLNGYKLWNTFFDLIYQNKGVEWLVILEPVVKKYHKTYNIQMPTIFKTKMLEQRKKIENLSTLKESLEDKVAKLEHKVSETSEKLLKCPITGLYNQRFMIQHLINNIDQPLEDNQTRALITVYIDNLISINRNYGSEKGDETLRNLAYLIERTKSNDTLAFKQNGPGIFIYKHQVSLDQLKTFIVKLRQAVQDSDLFIEPITISMSIVKFRELNDKYETVEKVNQWIELSLMRLEKAKQRGIDQIVDDKNDDKQKTDGLILLVDEDETYQNLMVKIFDRIQYKVLIAKDIYEALELLEKHQIDVIISEINLSKLDGFQLKQKINDSINFKDIPFVITSHHKNLDVITRCNLLDVDLVLRKPIIPEELIGYVRRVRNQRVIL